MARAPRHALNGICAYFTMFPLAFPLRVLRGRAEPGDLVLDPFCGRGTTNYASRLLGLPTAGVDSSPVAVALSQAKLANATPAEILSAAEDILRDVPEPASVPAGPFWDWAYHPEVLNTLCRLREGLLENGGSAPRQALRGLLMGGLHGPRPDGGSPWYVSNQCQRTYAPKPSYAVRYWESRGLRPPHVDVLGLIRRRAGHYYGREPSRGRGTIVQADSREASAVRQAVGAGRVRWVIASPPYYGMDTYLADQWLRLWFVGGAPVVSYATPGQLDHTRPRQYVAQLRQVWRNAGAVCEPGAWLVIRFGGINDRKVKPIDLARASLAESGWSLAEVRHAGSATRGKRQALHFRSVAARPLEEHDLWAVWRP